MKCRIKVKDKEDCYYSCLLANDTFHFTYRDGARIFDSVEQAKKSIAYKKLKDKIKIEKIYKGGK